MPFTSLFRGKKTGLRERITLRNETTGQVFFVFYQWVIRALEMSHCLGVAKQVDIHWTSMNILSKASTYKREEKITKLSSRTNPPSSTYYSHKSSCVPPPLLFSLSQSLLLPPSSLVMATATLAASAAATVLCRFVLLTHIYQSLPLTGIQSTTQNVNLLSSLLGLVLPTVTGLIGCKSLSLSI